MYKVRIELDSSYQIFTVSFTDLNDLKKWLIPVLATSNWTNYDIFDKFDNPMDDNEI